MKTIRVVNGQVITEQIGPNGIARITVEPYDLWERKLHQAIWWEKASETIEVL